MVSITCKKHECIITQLGPIQVKLYKVTSYPLFHTIINWNAKHVQYRIRQNLNADLKLIISTCH